MREIICLSVPAALMLFLVQLLTKKKMKIIKAILNFMIYMALNSMCVIVLLGPFRKVGLILGEHGEMTLFYGGAATITSIVVAIGLSVLISFLYKNVRIIIKVNGSKGESDV